MRQPPASWQTDAFVEVGAQTRLQQVVQPGHTSPPIEQPPLESAAQVPAVLPDGIWQLPLQHSLPEKQTSLSGWQPAPVEMQVLPWQLLEQQSPLAPHALPSVLQLPATTGAHMPPAQLPLQHCASPSRRCRLRASAGARSADARQAAALHRGVQVPPLATQPPPAPPPPVPPEPPPPITQVRDAVSQLPTQQSASMAQVSPGAAHMPPPSPPPTFISLLPLLLE